MAIRIFQILFVLTFSAPLSSFAGDKYGPFYVDTGSHTCTSIGQEKKVGQIFKAGNDRYFIKETVKYTEKSRFGGGDCRIMSVEEKNISAKLSTGQTVMMPVPVSYTVRAFADCTNNPAKLGSRIATECQFSAETQEFE